jgi:methyltransferase (TIGR00027 family)
LAPSPSARWTAAQRLRLARTRPATPSGDLEGEARLYRAVAGAASSLPPGRVGDLRARTRVVDAEVAQAIGRGTTQIVLVGAGYDGRPLRFASDTVRWFDADRSGVLADKQRRWDALGLRQGHVVPVRADPETDDLGTALEEAGHARGLPSLFVCETILLGLSLATSASLCASLRACAAPGSTLVATVAVAPEPTTPLQALRASRRALAHLAGEPRRDDLRPGDPEKLMVVTGWHVVRTERAGEHVFDRGALQLVLVCEASSEA